MNPKKLRAIGSATIALALLLCGGSGVKAFAAGAESLDQLSTPAIFLRA